MIPAERKIIGDEISMGETGKIELALFAPNNQDVALIADWNHWQRQPMSKGEDGWWRITADLEDGDYLYKFAVKSLSWFAKDQWKEVFDPYGLSITNDEKEQTRLRVRGGKRCWVEYEWKHDAAPLPPNEQIVIYEMHVGDFTGSMDKKTRGTFLGAIEKLDYLAEMGINAVELMPVKEFPGKSWGYNVRSLFAVDSSYGTPEELCQLVDACHARGMRVIMDGVYNHADADAPLAQIDYEYWFYRENPDPKPLQWGPKYNYTYFDEKLKVFPARKYVMESIRDWVRHFHIDGIRFDATVAIRNFDVMREFTDLAFKQIDGRKPFITIAEHIPEDPAICGYPKGPMVAAWHDSFGKQLQAIATRHERDGAQPWDLDTLEKKMNPATNGYGSGNHVINYVTSHDQERIMRQLGEIGKTFDEAAFRRVKLALSLLLTSPGLPMIWMGQEFGAANRKSPEPQPIDWNLLKSGNNRDLQQYVSKLINLRRKNPVFQDDHFQTLLKDQERCLFAYKRWNDVGAVAVVVANLRDADTGEFSLPEKSMDHGQWMEMSAAGEKEITVDAGNGSSGGGGGGGGAGCGTIKTSLGPSEVKVFVKK
jgi:1,4-alpha-glucan branching enzyme